MFKILSVLFGLLAAVPAQAISDLSVVVGGNRATFKQSGVHPAVTPEISYAGGVLAGFGKGLLSLETGLLYVNSKYKMFTRITTIRTNFNTDVSVNAIEVPLLLRLSAGFLTFGAGGYYARALNSTITTTSTLDNGPTTASTSTTTGVSSNDFGAMAMIRFRVIDTGAMAIFLDGLYLHGIADVDSTTTKSNTRNLQAFLGVQFNMGK